MIPSKLHALHLIYMPQRRVESMHEQHGWMHCGVQLRALFVTMLIFSILGDLHAL